METLLTDQQWGVVDHELCFMIDFVPLAKIENSKVVGVDVRQPYALVTFTYPKIESNLFGAISHKNDFLRLSLALAAAEKSLEEGSGEMELLFSWVKSDIRQPRKILSRFLPGLSIMLCKDGAYDIITNPERRDEMRGEAGWDRVKPILKLDPDYLL